MSRQFTLADASSVYAFAETGTALGLKVQDALGVIDKALDDYGLDHVALSFNGGKDCTVLIHLLAASFLRRLPSPSPTSSSSSSSPPRIQCVYVRCDAPFPQVETFVDVCEERYHLQLEAVEGDMKHALKQYLDHKEPKIEAVLVGTRRGDPHGALLGAFNKTDGDWPEFMRVHPILDWTYGEIWEFLRSPSMRLGEGPQEWCELYDEGYTSLGSTHNTFPNPLLANGSSWRPAWELTDPSQERAGSAPQEALEDASVSVTRTVLKTVFVFVLVTVSVNVKQEASVMPPRS
ncbi:hypothetical protein RQP46_009544 [Phenoliferia psychrophenolica]